MGCMALLTVPSPSIPTRLVVTTLRNSRCAQTPTKQAHRAGCQPLVFSVSYLSPTEIATDNPHVASLIALLTCADTESAAKLRQGSSIVSRTRLACPCTAALCCLLQRDTIVGQVDTGRK